MVVALGVGLAGLAAMAFPEVPKDSAIALGATKGKSFESGLVFINGKFLPPPYLVERWGTGLRINGKPVTGQVVDWNEFLKTQSGVKETKTETGSAAPAPTAAAATEDDADSSLDDLFDENPKPKKKAKKTAKKAAPAPTASVSYSLDGAFAPNETTRKYVKRINSVRSRIDRSLREGAIVFFGDTHRRVTVNSRMAGDLLAKLPEIMRDSTSADDLYSRIHAAHIEYLSAPICSSLYRNRIDYRSLQERRSQIKRDRELQKLLNSAD